jgi:hypothetical protein
LELNPNITFREVETGKTHCRDAPSGVLQT